MDMNTTRYVLFLLTIPFFLFAGGGETTFWWALVRCHYFG
jgi:hypothetical protein